MSDTTPTIRLDDETLKALTIQAVAAIKEVCGSKAFQEGVSDMPSVWVRQRKEEVEKLGANKAPWWCFWLDPHTKKQVSKSCGPGKDGHKLANQLKRKTEAELTLGTYGRQEEKTWAEFRHEYETKVLAGHSLATQRCELEALANFERIVKPGRMGAVCTASVDAFVAGRRRDRSKRNPEECVSAATINKDLRHLKAVLKKAFRWKYLAEMPDFTMQRELKKLPAYLLPEHFAALYRACNQMDKPAGQPYPPADWWRGLLATLYMVGWRVGAVLALRRADVDLERGLALTRAEDTKGRRDQCVPIHPEVIRHWRKLPGFSEELFPWPYHARTLWVEMYRLCELAGVPRYGFHAAKKAFCTLNARRIPRGSMTLFAQHESPATTDKFYINAEHDLEEDVQKLFVPDVLRTGTDG